MSSNPIIGFVSFLNKWEMAKNFVSFWLDDKLWGDRSQI